MTKTNIIDDILKKDEMDGTNTLFYIIGMINNLRQIKEEFDNKKGIKKFILEHSSEYKRYIKAYETIENIIISYGYSKDPLDIHLIKDIYDILNIKDEILEKIMKDIEIEYTIPKDVDTKYNGIYTYDLNNDTYIFLYYISNNITLQIYQKNGDNKIVMGKRIFVSADKTSFDMRYGISIIRSKMSELLLKYMYYTIQK